MDEFDFVFKDKDEFIKFLQFNYDDEDIIDLIISHKNLKFSTYELRKKTFSQLSEILLVIYKFNYNALINDLEWIHPHDYYEQDYEDEDLYQLNN
jgi:hypothetical protein